MAARHYATRRTATTKRGNSGKIAWMAAERARRIGARVRERRKELGWTQAKLAEQLAEPSVTSTYISRWERGEHEPLGDRLDLIADALGTTSEDLMAGPVAGREPKPAETPDALRTLGGNQLDRIEARLADLVNELRGWRTAPAAYDEAEGFTEEQEADERAEQRANRDSP